ncbi:MAG: response regulator transcription factor [Candidatus Dormibacteraceae bacterium]
MPTATRNRTAEALPALPPGLDVYRPPEVYGSVVLVVEDEAPMRRQLEIDLQALGYRVHTAADAEAALEILQAVRVSGLLLDLVLDEREDSGFELLQRIRASHPGLPVLVLSAAQATSAGVRRAYELGASGYFVKGSTPMAHVYSDLAARMLEGAQGRQGSYRFGQLDFDPTRRTIKLNENQIRLTAQQAALIIHLAQGSQSATASDLIQAGLFRPDAARSTVHSALLALRRKLDELEEGLGSRLLMSTPRGYSLGSLG